FQNENLPPPNAVHGPKENDYWTTQREKERPLFRLLLEFLLMHQFLLSSETWHNNNKDTLLKSNEALVVEAWGGQNPTNKQPVDVVYRKQLRMGGSGTVTFENCTPKNGK
ncbi:16332_t:CDS:2, partial [Funneliformis geosporum]